MKEIVEVHGTSSVVEETECEGELRRAREVLEKTGGRVGPLPERLEVGLWDRSSKAAEVISSLQEKLTPPHDAAFSREFLARKREVLKQLQQVLAGECECTCGCQRFAGDKSKFCSACLCLGHTARKEIE